MTNPEIRNLVTMIMAVVGGVACFAYAFTDQRRKAKKPFYAIAGIGFVMSALIYAVGVFINPAQPGLNDFWIEVYQLLRAGWLGAGVYWLLVSAFIGIIVTDWRTNDRN